MIRGEKVILDVHLAELYGVETRALKQAVRRNYKRFPADFMFELSVEEIDMMVSQNVIPSKKHFGGATPYAFTENGVAMLSSVLTSQRAIEVNIKIMRTFTMLRKKLVFTSEVTLELEQIRKQIDDHGNSIILIFEYLRQFEEAKQQQTEQASRRKIGFKISKKK